MAPEIIAGRGHSKVSSTPLRDKTWPQLTSRHAQTADWWSVGVLLFEMLSGNAPFRAKNRGVLQKKILTEKIKYPTFLTSAAHKFLTALLQRDEVRSSSVPVTLFRWTDACCLLQSKRLGSGLTGAEDVQKHEFFKPINWRKLERREVRLSSAATLRCGEY